ncbi:zf-HC2 domain-containing protein [Streptomyces sp. NPDC045431]|uniref:zf-HC2 domain-containing protein n=1 Tax=Streptomyces sp. NPDC045431 TaxID=3155613 RepID=UPI0033C476F4
MGLRERHHDAADAADVAAYALGVLEPADALRCEEHLAACVPCAMRLADLTGTVAALAQLAGREPPRPGRVAGRVAGPGQGRGPGRRTRRGRGHRRGAARLPRVRRWRGRLVAAAAALAVGVPGAALLVAGDEPASPGRAAVAATDPATGVTAALALRDRAWGTELAVRVAGVRGPRVCDLVAVGRDGREWPVMSWATPVDGHEDGDEPVIEGGTALRRDEIARLEVRDREGRRLVSVLP